MFENYGHSVKVTLRVSTADDSNKYHSTDFDIYSTYPLQPIEQQGRRLAYGHERPIINASIARHTNKGEPLILGIKSALLSALGWGSRSYYYKAPDNFKVAFVLPNCGNATFMIEKKKPFYKLMEQRMTKKNLLIALSRALYRSCFEDDAQTLMVYLFRMINLPENVSYVLENRTPYWFFDIETREKMEVRLNTRMISNDTAALEISDGIWAPISVKDLDTFVNYFYHDNSRAKKWAYMSPKKLWTVLMETSPSTSQEKLMVEFLSQNRTQDIVENRARELMESLTKRYPDRIRILERGKFTLMLIRGKKADWVIIDSTYKTQIQKVKTYVYIDGKYVTEGTRGGTKFIYGQLRGPICIDNVHTNSSVGDQYAARGLALLNDTITMKLVNTISRYIPKELLDDPEAESRFDFEGFTGQEEEWRVIE